MVDIASVNSYILHQSYRDNPKVTRYDFVKPLAIQMVKPEMERRLQNSRITREVRICIKRVLQIKEDNNIAEEEKFEVRKTCRRCPASKRRQTSNFCIICKIPICMECTKTMFCLRNSSITPVAVFYIVSHFCTITSLLCLFTFIFTYYVSTSRYFHNFCVGIP